VTEAELRAALHARIPELVALEANGDVYFYVDAVDRRHPILTLVTDDKHDPASDLSRPGVYRLNIGVSPETYRARFGELPTFRTDGGVADRGTDFHGRDALPSPSPDFTALDVVMPHPVYAAMAWVCVLCPSEATFAALLPLVDEARSLGLARAALHAGRG
jgi:hypothetical protein